MYIDWGISDHESDGLYIQLSACGGSQAAEISEMLKWQTPSP